MRLKPAILVVLLIAFTWAGAGGISFLVVELTAGGPQGERGIQGPAGPQGPAEPSGATFDDAPGPLKPFEIALVKLATMWASDSVGEDTEHPATLACVRYILFDEGSRADCRFFPVEP